MQARIYRPTKSAAQSGAKSKKWILELLADSNWRSVDKAMGWTGSNDMTQELRMQFDSQIEAEAFAKSNNITYEISTPKSKKIAPKAYADNFKMKMSD